MAWRWWISWWFHIYVTRRTLRYPCFWTSNHITMQPAQTITVKHFKSCVPRSRTNAQEDSQHRLAGWQCPSLCGPQFAGPTECHAVSDVVGQGGAGVEQNFLLTAYTYCHVIFMCFDRKRKHLKGMCWYQTAMCKTWYSDLGSNPRNSLHMEYIDLWDSGTVVWILLVTLCDFALTSSVSICIPGTIVHTSLEHTQSTADSI